MLYLLRWSPRCHSLPAFCSEFRLSDDMYAQDSIELLKQSGIDFAQARSRACLLAVVPCPPGCMFSCQSSRASAPRRRAPLPRACLLCCDCTFSMRTCRPAMRGGQRAASQPGRGLTSAAAPHLAHPATERDARHRRAALWRAAHGVGGGAERGRELLLHHSSHSVVAGGISAVLWCSTAVGPECLRQAADVVLNEDVSRLCIIHLLQGGRCFFPAPCATSAGMHLQYLHLASRQPHLRSLVPHCRCGGSPSTPATTLATCSSCSPAPPCPPTRPSSSPCSRHVGISSRALAHSRLGAAGAAPPQVLPVDVR